jgi:hypothetical protein
VSVNLMAIQALPKLIDISEKMDNREKAIATMGALKAAFVLLFAAVFISSHRWLNFELNHCANLPARILSKNAWLAFQSLKKCSW